MSFSGVNSLTSCMNSVVGRRDRNAAHTNSPRVALYRCLSLREAQRNGEAVSNESERVLKDEKAHRQHAKRLRPRLDVGDAALEGYPRASPSRRLDTLPDWIATSSPSISAVYFRLDILPLYVSSW